LTVLAHTRGPLCIDEVAAPSGGILGLMNCPGRNGLDGAGRVWSRDLADDLDAIRAWRADMLLSLVEPHEFIKLGVPQFADAVAGTGLQWYLVPIRDMQSPDDASIAAWRVAGPQVLATLRRGGRVALHCAAGLGRTGTMAAKILVTMGVPGVSAITLVRTSRPGTIETATQEQYVLGGPELPVA